MVGRGADVIGLVRDHVPQAQLFRSGTAKQVTTVNGQLADYGLLERVLAEYEIDTVFHLAAQTIVGIANRSPLSTFETNIRGHMALVRGCAAQSDRFQGYCGQQ